MARPRCCSDKEPPANAGSELKFNLWVKNILGRKQPLCILAWQIPWTEESWWPTVTITQERASTHTQKNTKLIGTSANNMQYPNLGKFS